MASVANVKNIGSTFGNDVEMLRVRYDFAADGGATGALNLFTAASDVVVTAIYAMVKTTVTSGGSATVSVGVTGTANYFVDAAAVAGLTANATLRPTLTEGTPNVLKLPVRLASGDAVTQTIGTAALTAGVIEYVVTYTKA